MERAPSCELECWAGAKGRGGRVSRGAVRVSRCAGSVQGWGGYGRGRV